SGFVDRFRMHESSLVAVCCMSREDQGMSARMSGRVSGRKRLEAVGRELRIAVPPLRIELRVATLLLCVELCIVDRVGRWVAYLSKLSHYDAEPHQFWPIVVRFVAGCARLSAARVASHAFRDFRCDILLIFVRL
ncbi:hypothetical protein HAX54_029889, partial [Datura stramonium]|nr:hypothetical protein [Datura stramonium]